MKILACLAAVILLMSGCSKKDEGGGGGGGEGGKIEFSDPGVEFSYESATKDLVEIKAAIKKGEDSKYSCAAAETYAEALLKEKNAKVKATGEEVIKVCSYEAPLAWADANIKKIEEVKKTKPDETLIGECANASVSLDKLKLKYKDDAKVKALDDKYKKVCPQ